MLQTCCSLRQQLSTQPHGRAARPAGGHRVWHSSSAQGCAQIRQGPQGCAVSAHPNSLLRQDCCPRSTWQVQPPWRRPLPTVTVRAQPEEGGPAEQEVSAPACRTSHLRHWLALPRAPEASVYLQGAAEEEDSSGEDVEAAGQRLVAAAYAEDWQLGAGSGQHY